MTKKELVEICQAYLEEPKYKVNKIPKYKLEYPYYEVILPAVFENNATEIDLC